ncbi:MAG TPA: hypothetical protein DEH78_31995, partial [Solibacterales bacterium]|nr:hypothetical protein [Bryobacterales bacterium]
MLSPNTHLEGERLAAFAAAELPPSEMSAAENHLAGCGECRERVQQTQAALDGFAEYHQEWKRAMPPPKPWTALRLEGSRGARAARLWWAAAAAAAVGAVLLVSTFRPQTVSAAELLEKALTRERQPAPPRRLRIKVQNLLYTRPAVGSDRTPALAGLKERFEAAHFDWENPLSAGAFHNWRSRLPQKEDSVTVLSGSEQGYRITTKTNSGQLAQVALTLRASDLRAVQNVLTFRDTLTVELLEEAEPAAPYVAAPAPAPGAMPAEPSAVSPAASELDVLAALHRIGADLGEPVEVERRGETLTVTATGLDEERRRELREALETLPGVSVRFEGRDTKPAVVENDLVEFSESIIARAHALSSLPEP